MGVGLLLLALLALALALLPLPLPLAPQEGPGLVPRHDGSTARRDRRFPGRVGPAATVAACEARRCSTA